MEYAWFIVPFIILALLDWAMIGCINEPADKSKPNCSCPCNNECGECSYQWPK